MNSFYIGNRKVGYNEPPLVIAEIGINHNGSLELAKQLVDVAIAAGAEVIKHQTHIVDEEMSEFAKRTIPGHTDKSIYEIIDNCSLNETEEWELMKYVQERGAIFISTPFSRAAADRLQSFNVPAFKIGSGECNNYPLLKHIASFGKPIILSTGMNNLDTIRGAVNIFEDFSIDYALLHTTNLYPTDPELVRLGAINDIRRNFPRAIVGLSDHTTSNLACLGAVALGACIVERHFTDSMDRVGPDIVCSMDGIALSDLIRDSAIMQKMRDGNKVDLLEEEQVTRNFAFSTVVSIKDIAEGEELTIDNIWVKRPGIGEISAKDFDSILGKKAMSFIPINTHLKNSDFR
jgi:sialic acid synthase SpsE